MNVLYTHIHYTYRAKVVLPRLELLSMKSFDVDAVVCPVWTQSTQTFVILHLQINIHLHSFTFYLRWFCIPYSGKTIIKHCCTIVSVVIMPGRLQLCMLYNMVHLGAECL